MKLVVIILIVLWVLPSQAKSPKGKVQEVNFEGQAAIELEAIADPEERGRYEYEIAGELNFRPAIRQIGPEHQEQQKRQIPQDVLAALVGRAARLRRWSRRVPGSSARRCAAPVPSPGRRSPNRRGFPRRR